MGRYCGTKPGRLHYDPPHGTVPVRLHPAALEARAADDPAAGDRLDADLLLDARPAAQQVHRHLHELCGGAPVQE